MAPQQPPEDGSHHDGPALDAAGDDSSSDALPTAAAGHPFLVYTAARILVFLAAAGILYLVGARGILLVLLALIVSGLVSFVLLSSLRDRVSERVATRMDASRERREQAAAAEDDIL